MLVFRHSSSHNRFLTPSSCLQPYTKTPVQLMRIHEGNDTQAEKRKQRNEKEERGSGLALCVDIPKVQFHKQSIHTSCFPWHILASTGARNNTGAIDLPVLR